MKKNIIILFINNTKHVKFILHIIIKFIINEIMKISIKHNKEINKKKRK